jgi:hypothetical protein
MICFKTRALKRREQQLLWQVANWIIVAYFVS